MDPCESAGQTLQCTFAMLFQGTVPCWQRWQRWQRFVDVPRNLSWLLSLVFTKPGWLGSCTCIPPAVTCLCSAHTEAPEAPSLQAIGCWQYIISQLHQWTKVVCMDQHKADCIVVVAAIRCVNTIRCQQTVAPQALMASETIIVRYLLFPALQQRARCYSGSTACTSCVMHLWLAWQLAVMKGRKMVHSMAVVLGSVCQCLRVAGLRSVLRYLRQDNGAAHSHLSDYMDDWMVLPS